MKKTVKVLAIAGCIILGASACDQEIEEVKVDVQDQQLNNPDEPDPWCDNPNGCPSTNS